jgi:uncharacterized protein YbjQ (UPF0145 family)
MILSTTPSLEGRTIREYKGIVTGEAILGANIFKDLFAGIRDIVGGRSQQASELGANAVVGVDLDYEVLGANQGMLMVTASGTAVRAE